MPKETHEDEKKAAAKSEIKQKRLAAKHDDELIERANKEHLSHSSNHHSEEEEEQEEKKETKKEVLEKVLVLGAMALALVATVVTGGIAPIAIAATAATMNMLAVPLKMKIKENIKGKHRKMVKGTLISNTARRTFEFTEAVSNLGKHAFVFGAVASVFETIALPIAAFALVAAALSFSTALIAHKKDPTFANKCAVTGTFMVMLASGASVGLGIAALATGIALVANPITGPVIASVILTATLIKSAPYIHKFFKNIVAPKLRSVFKIKPKPQVTSDKEDNENKVVNENKIVNEKKIVNEETLAASKVDSLKETKVMAHDQKLQSLSSLLSKDFEALDPTPHHNKENKTISASAPAEVQSTKKELDQIESIMSQIVEKHEKTASAPTTKEEMDKIQKGIEGLILEHNKKDSPKTSAPPTVEEKPSTNVTHHITPREE